MFGGAWVWVPGRVVVGVRPVYAPALVAFVGGPRFGVAVAAGGVGMAAWFPLGPREAYVPAYHVSQVYVQQVNITHVNVTNVTVINNNVRYVNQGVPGAVTVVSHETFVGARPVHAGIMAVDTRVIATAPVVAVAPVAPVRVSVLAHAGPPVAMPPARIVERTVVVRNAPPPPPVAFAARQQALAANPGRPLEAAQVERFRATAPARPAMVRQAGPPAGPAIAPRNDRPFGAGAPNRPAGVAPAPSERRVENVRPVENLHPAAAPAERNERPAAPPAVRNDRPAAVPAARNDRPAAVQEQRHEGNQGREEHKGNNNNKGKREEKKEERKQ
jgi:hypothetical protein